MKLFTCNNPALRNRNRVRGWMPLHCCNRFINQRLFILVCEPPCEKHSEGPRDSVAMALRLSSDLVAPLGGLQSENSVVTRHLRLHLSCIEIVDSENGRIFSVEVKL